MKDEFEIQLKNPLSKADWDKLIDVNMEHTKVVTFATPDGMMKKYIPIEVLQEILCDIKAAQTYKMAEGDCGLYIDRDTAISIINRKIKEVEG